MNHKKNLVRNLLKLNKEKIKSAYISGDLKVLQVSIVLKNDNDTNRNIFYEFLEEYDSSKIIFHFVSKDLEENINKIEKLI